MKTNDWRLPAAKKAAKEIKRFIARVDRIKTWVAARPAEGEDQTAWMEARPPQRAFPSKNAKHKAYDRGSWILRMFPEIENQMLDMDDLRAIVKTVEAM